MKTKDIMITGVYTALYFVFLCLGTLVAVIVEHNANMKYAPAFTALFAGTIYMLLIAKTRKFGSILLMSAVLSLFFFLSGHFVLSFLPSLFCGLIADMIARIGQYRSKYYNLLSYIIFSFGNLAPIIMMWLIREAYIDRLIARGKDAAYINEVMVDFNVTNVSWLAATIILGALIGGFFGQYMLKKHFSKAGLV